MTSGCSGLNASCVNVAYIPKEIKLINACAFIGITLPVVPARVVSLDFTDSTYFSSLFPAQILAPSRTDTRCITCSRDTSIGSMEASTGLLGCMMLPNNVASQLKSGLIVRRYEIRQVGPLTILHKLMQVHKLSVKLNHEDFLS